MVCTSPPHYPACLRGRLAFLLSRYQPGLKASQRRSGTATVLSGRAVALQCWIHLGVDGTFASSGKLSSICLCWFFPERRLQRPPIDPDEMRKNSAGDGASVGRRLLGSGGRWAERTENDLHFGFPIEYVPSRAGGGSGVLPWGFCGRRSVMTDSEALPPTSGASGEPVS
jgi:hypothetical protein